MSSTGGVAKIIMAVYIERVPFLFTESMFFSIFLFQVDLLLNHPPSHIQMFLDDWLFLYPLFWTPEIITLCTECLWTGDNLIISVSENIRLPWYQIIEIVQVCCVLPACLTCIFSPATPRSPVTSTAPVVFETVFTPAQKKEVERCAKLPILNKLLKLNSKWLQVLLRFTSLCTF